MYGARHAELAAMPKPPVPNGRALGFDVLTFPRLDGSTSTHPLVVIIASRLLDVPYDWHYAELSDRNYAGVRVPAYPRELLLNDLPVSHDDTPMELTAARVYAGGETERQRRIASLINSDLASNTHTHQSYENLINGTRDLIFVGRAPSEDELRLAREKGVELELSPVATDALVFIVHEDNPVKNLSIEQLRGAYRKTFRNWEEVGGTSDEIVPLAREKNSGSRELFDSLKVMGDEPLNYEPGQLYAEGMMGPYNMIMQSRGGLGYSLFYFEHFMAMSPYTRTIAIDGVEPTLASLASGQYRFAKPVYAAIRKTDTPQSAGRRLVAWLVSPEGQAVVRESGYLPFHR
jgi:phosphate transport system substrate-binding protein